MGQGSTHIHCRSCFVRISVADQGYPDAVIESYTAIVKLVNRRLDNLDHIGLMVKLHAVSELACRNLIACCTQESMRAHGSFHATKLPCSVCCSVMNWIINQPGRFDLHWISAATVSIVTSCRAVNKLSTTWVETRPISSELVS